ncbi:MAG: hypothetical protein IKP76_02355 [Bacilli bacterium]|nr:hypothetical protein [Bacilli bacterium]
MKKNSEYKNMKRELKSVEKEINKSVKQTEKELTDSFNKAADNALKEYENNIEVDSKTKRRILLASLITIGAIGVAFKWADYKGYINPHNTHKVESYHKVYDLNSTKETDTNIRNK